MQLILVAEDEDHLYRMLEFRLKRAGYEVERARNGEEAISLTRSRSPELVLLDVMMPVLDGFQALKRLKSDDATKGVPVILLTASAQESDVTTGIDAGAADYITKPFSFPELLARIRRTLA